MTSEYATNKRKRTHACAHMGDVTGFTLIEFLLYTALTVVMVVLLGEIGISILQGKTASHTLEEVQYSAPRLFQAITTAVHESASITEPGAGATSSELSLATDDETTNPIVFSARNGALLMQGANGEARALSSSGVYVENILFRNVSSVGDPGTVRIEMTIRPRGSGAQILPGMGDVFYTTVQIRK